MNITIDLEKFMNPNQITDPELLIRMYDETPILKSDFEEFLKLPCNDEYIKRKKITIIDDKKVIEIKPDE